MADNENIAVPDQDQPEQAQNLEQLPAVAPVAVVLPAQAIMPIPLVINIPGALPIPIVIQVPLELQVPAMMPAPIFIQIQDFALPQDQVQDQQQVEAPADEDEDDDVELIKHVHIGSGLFMPKILPENFEDDDQPPTGPKKSMGMVPKS